MQVQGKRNLKLIDGYSSFDSNLLLNRGISTREDADRFFNASFYDLNDYWMIKDYRECVYFLKDAIDKKKKIIVFGDYDVDGVTSTDIIFDGFTTLGADISWRLPCRIKEGYSIRLSAVKEIVEQGYDLIILVDNGIRANEPIKYAREHGVDVVVLDHHMLGSELPQANYIIDLHRPDETYPYVEFAGCGVAFMIMRGLYFLFGYSDDFCKRHLDMVAIGTIADVMLLTGENRILVKEGLKIINSPDYDRSGIKALMKLQCLTDDVTATDIGFYIAPCLNAPGRLFANGADLSLQLVLTDDMQSAIEQASHIYDINEYRKTLQSDGTLKAIEYIEKNHLKKSNIIIVYLDDISEGIIGLISGEITRRYHRPSIVFTKNARNNYKASARSIETVDLYECLNAYDNIFVNYGGHEMAAGMEIVPENFDILVEILNDFVDLNYDKSVFDENIFYESEVKPDEINVSLFDKLKKYEPCGNGNPRPILYVKGFDSIQKKLPFNKGISHYEFMGKEAKGFKMYGERAIIQSFSLGEKYSDLHCPKALDCLFTLMKSTYNGETNLIMDAIDIDEPVNTSFVKQNVSVINEIHNLANLL